jgi:hypothetical protein
MEEKIIISKPFRNNAFRVYQYLLKEFSAKTAFIFLDRLEKRIEFNAKNPTVGKLRSIPITETSSLLWLRPTLLVASPIYDEIELQYELYNFY